MDNSSSRVGINEMQRKVELVAVIRARPRDGIAALARRN